MANKTLGTRQKMVYRPAPGRQDLRAAPPPPPRAQRRRGPPPPKTSTDEG